MAPTVTSAPGTGSVVGAFAWSQEDGSAGAEPVPYVEDRYDDSPGTGRRPAARRLRHRSPVAATRRGCRCTHSASAFWWR